MLQDLARTVAVAAVALLLALTAAFAARARLWYGPWLRRARSPWVSPLYKRYLDERMSVLLRNNLIIRSQAEGAREAERQRIAADFHDGPLQSFISFQMRLEIIKKLLARDAAARRGRTAPASGSVPGPGGGSAQLRAQHAAGGRRHEPQRVLEPHGGILPARRRHLRHLHRRRVSRSLRRPRSRWKFLQIVRETLNNIQKHSGATRVAVSAARGDQQIGVTVEDNGAGFPFSGTFYAGRAGAAAPGAGQHQAARAHAGRRLVIESKPGQGAKIEIRVPM